MKSCILQALLLVIVVCRTGDNITGQNNHVQGVTGNTIKGDDNYLNAIDPNDPEFLAMLLGEEEEESGSGNVDWGKKEEGKTVIGG